MEHAPPREFPQSLRRIPLTTLLAIFLFTLGCGYMKGGNVVQGTDHLKYFSFFDNNSSITDFQQTFQILDGSSNLYCLGAWYDDVILDEARTHHAKVAVDPTWVFFARPGTDFVLRIDYLASWQAALPQFQRNQDVIEAFYVLDEPFGNTPTRNPADVVKEMELVAGLIKQSFPDVKIWTTYDAASVARSYYD